MRTTIQNLRTGDMIRGLGLVVEIAEPQSDYTTNVEGYVVLDRGGETESKEAVSVVLPNEHVVNVRRPFVEGDKVTVNALNPEGEYGHLLATVMHVVPSTKSVMVLVDWNSAVLEVPFYDIRHAA